jgi:hypothetical protein
MNDAYQNEHNYRTNKEVDKKYLLSGLKLKPLFEMSMSEEQDTERINFCPKQDLS